MCNCAMFSLDMIQDFDYNSFNKEFLSLFFSLVHLIYIVCLRDFSCRIVDAYLELLFMKNTIWNFRESYII